MMNWNEIRIPMPMTVLPVLLDSPRDDCSEGSDTNQQWEHIAYSRVKGLASGFSSNILVQDPKYFDFTLLPPTPEPTFAPGVTETEPHSRHVI